MSIQFEVIAKAVVNHRQAKIVSRRVSHNYALTRDGRPSDSIDVELRFAPGFPSVRDSVFMERVFYAYQRSAVDVEVRSTRSLGDETNPEVEVILSMRSSLYIDSLVPDQERHARAAMAPPVPELSAEGKQTVKRLMGEYKTIIPDGLLNAIAASAAIPTSPYNVMVRVDSVTLAGQIRVEYLCRAGDMSSHDWIDVRSEGPTARRCTRCKRVTGQFYGPKDFEQIVDWLVSTTKSLVLLWARSIDTTVARYAMLEFDSGGPVAEDAPDDQRFALLEFK